MRTSTTSIVSVQAEEMIKSEAEMIDEATKAFAKLKEKFITAGIQVDPDELVLLKDGKKEQLEQKKVVATEEFKIEYDNLPKKKISRIQQRFIRVIKESKIPSKMPQTLVYWNRCLTKLNPNTQSFVKEVDYKQFL